MSYWNCDNPRDHQREAERDFHSRGMYGANREYERERNYDDCAKAYMDRFDSMQREERNRREDEETAQHAAEMRAYNQRQEDRMMEDEQLQQEYDRQAREEHYRAQEDAHFATLAQEQEEALRVSDQSENPATTSGADCSDERGPKGETPKT